MIDGGRMLPTWGWEIQEIHMRDLQVQKVKSYPGHFRIVGDLV